MVASSRTVPRPLALALLLALLLALAACSSPARAPVVEDPVVRIDDLETQLLGAIETVIDVACPGGPIAATEVRGTTRRGAEYLLYRPRDGWNRDLVLYAHGYVAPAAPVGWGDPLPASLLAARRATVCAGYALAASSFRANGYAVEEGIGDTLLLLPIFGWHFRTPVDDVLGVGLSLGSLVVHALAESTPYLDGALALCGLNGGSLLQFAYVGSVVTLAAHLIEATPGLELPPGITAANVLDPPTFPGLTPTETTTAIAAAILETLALPAAAPLLATLATTTVRFAPGAPPVPLLQFDPSAPSTLAAALLGPFGFYAVGLRDAVERGGGLAFDNRRISYEVPGAPLDPYAGLPTYRADPEALAYYALYYQPRATLAVPTLLAHTLVDPTAPVYHTVGYAALAAARGRSDRLQTAVVARSGHCAFAPEELAALVGALAGRVEAGAWGPLPPGYAPVPLP